MPVTQTVSPTAIGSSEAFGTAVVAGPIIAIGIPSTEAFGTANVIGAQLQAFGIPSGEAFGLAVVALVGQSVFPVGIASAEAFGTAVVSEIAQQAVSLLGLSWDDGEALGTPTVTAPTGPHIISPVGIP